MRTYNKPNTKLLSLNINQPVLEEAPIATSIQDVPITEPLEPSANQVQFNDAIDDLMK